MSTISVTSINDGDAVTAASINNQVNTIVNDYNGNITAANLAANAVTSAKITNANVTPDKLATGATRASVATSETTAAQTFNDLTTTTDTVTVTIGANGLALVALGGVAGANAINTIASIGFAISGASTVVASDIYSLDMQTYAANARSRIGGAFLVTGLATGSTTFKMKYKVNGNTGTWSDRYIVVIPL